MKDKIESGFTDERLEHFMTGLGGQEDAVNRRFLAEILLRLRQLEKLMDDKKLGL